MLQNSCKTKKTSQVRLDPMKRLKLEAQIWGAFTLVIVMSSSIYFLLQAVLPDWKILHGEKAGNLIVLICTLSAIAIAYFLIRGFIVWRDEKNSKDHKPNE